MTGWIILGAFAAGFLFAELASAYLRNQKR